MKWFKRVHLLYLFGFFANFRPANPFVYEYYVTYRKLPAQEVRQDILPTFSYSTVIQLVFVFFFSEFCHYNPFIVISAISAIVATCVRTWTSSVFEMEVAEVFFGTAAATELAYYVSIYTYYDATDYQKATSSIRALPLAAKMFSSMFAQLSIKMQWLNYQELNYINLAACLIAAVLSTFIPTFKENVYYLASPLDADQKLPRRIGNTILLFKSSFINSFRQKYIKRWSLWSICTICSYTQISTFIQPLWKVLHDANGVAAYNGAVEATLNALSLFCVLLAGTIKINWKVRTVLLMHVISGLQFIFLFSMSSLYSVVFNYASYVVFGAIHHFVITGISIEIAKILEKGSFGLVFGFIHLVAAILNSVIVCVINDDVGYKLDPQQQFFAYFLIHIVIYAIFFIASIIKLRVDTIMTRHQQNQIPLEGHS